jgi:two-component system cell cycle sensor histidine kinase/response regulator CckA
MGSAFTARDGENRRRGNVTVEHSLNPIDPQSPECPAVVCKEARVAAAEPREHILIVDDEMRLVQIGREMLERLGYQVTGRTSSREALETVRLQPEKFDLVITDFTMPHMNGIELARELSRLRPGMPIILYTAISKAVTAEKAKKLGIKDYLMKPVSAAELHKAIRRVLDASLPKGGV